MNRILIIPFILLGLLIALSSCNENTVKETIEVDQGYEYFPLEVGKYITYQVDSVIYDVGNNVTLIDTIRTYIKEEITDTLVDNTGETVYRIQRYERSNVNDNWRVKDIWTSARTRAQAEKVEENLRFIKMVFPVTEGIEWNGNIFIDESTIIPIAGESIEVFKNWLYKIESMDQSETIGDFTFDRVTTVSQADSENLIELRFSIEKYAEDIGLVYREMRILDSQIIDESIPWEVKAQKGYILTQQVIDHN